MRQIGWRIDGYVKARAREEELAMMQAWMTANLTLTAFHKPQKFPPLSKVLPSKRQQNRARSFDQIKSALKAWGFLKG